MAIECVYDEKRIIMRDHEQIPYSLDRLSDEESIERARAFSDRLKKRRSCRYFSSDPVPRPVIEAAIEAAGSAPNGANHQPWHFAVIEGAQTKRAIREAAEAEERRFYGEDEGNTDAGPQASRKASDEWLGVLADLGTDARKPFLETAPYLIAVFAQRKGGIAEDGETQNYYVSESVGIACGMLIATLHEAGLATLTHTPSPMGFLRDICGRPEWERPLMIVVVGHPSADASVPICATRKKPLSQITSWF
jgi:nitroreductase